MRNSSSLDWLRFMHTPNDYRVSRERYVIMQQTKKIVSKLLGMKRVWIPLCLKSQLL